jgi:hypothetical protein
MKQFLEITDVFAEKYWTQEEILLLRLKLL